MRRLLPALLAALLAVSFAACGAPEAEAGAASPGEDIAPSEGEATSEAGTKPTTDRSGAAIALPDQVETVVSMAPSITETVIALGCGDMLVAVDNQSVGREGLPEGLQVFDIMTPDAEQLATLQPDVILVTGMSMAEGENPFQPLTDMGICVACIPTSESIQGIKEDIAFVAAVVGREAEGDRLIGELSAEIDRIGAIGATITEKKTVYFEVAAMPYAYSFGGDVYLSEMIELIGAVNVFADQSGWMSVEPEAAVASNPDVILTNVNYIDDPVGEILGRDGWASVAAVAGGEVHYIDNMSSSLANHNIVLALRQMAEAVYPEVYRE